MRCREHMTQHTLEPVRIRSTMEAKLHSLDSQKASSSESSLTWKSTGGVPSLFPEWKDIQEANWNEPHRGNRRAYSVNSHGNRCAERKSEATRGGGAEPGELPVDRCVRRGRRTGVKHCL